MRAERRHLAEAFVSSDPEAPTLCEGWTAADLVAHLVVREHEPLAAAGIVIPALADRHDAAIVRARQRHSYPDLVERFRTGPPLLWKPIDGVANLTELFVHHEDLRRGGGDTTPRPATQIADLEEALWRALGRSGRFMTRALRGTGVEAVTPAGDRARLRAGDRPVVLTGRPGELVLWLFGRRDAAAVELTGDPEAIERALSADLGI